MPSGAIQKGVSNPAFEIDGDEIKDDNNKKQDTPERDTWSNPIEFLLSCVAMSVGLGNVWRFPFTAYENGGGAFLIPYIIVLIFVGKPLYYMELCMGQFSSYGCVKLWDICPAFRGVGYGQVIATWCVVTYYVSLMALTVYYFFASFTSVLPWSHCPANYSNCVDIRSNLTKIDINTSISAAEVYFEDEVLNRHPNGLDDGIFLPGWELTLCLLLSWITLFLILVKGVKSSGKSAYFTALFPYIVLFILLGRGATLPGAINGIKYFITPKWEMLLQPKVWYNAVGQSFFSLSVGFGSVMMFSSYNKFRHNVYRDATIISVVDTLTSLLAGFTIFAILGHLAHQMGVDDVELVIKGGGSGLAFVSYPDVLSRFAYVPQLFAVLFFLMLFTLGIGSASALTACVITVICDEFPKVKRYLVTAIVCVIGFLLGLFYVTPQGQFILDLVDYYGGTFVIYVLAFLEVVAVQWIYGYANFIRDIKFMLDIDTGIYWAFCWKYFMPGLLFVVFAYNLAVLEPLRTGEYVFGTGANAFGVTIVVVSIGLVPVLFGFRVHKNKTSTNTWYEAMRMTFKATDGWGPKDPILGRQYRSELGTTSSKEGIDNPVHVEQQMEDKSSIGVYPRLDSMRMTTDSESHYL